MLIMTLSYTQRTNDTSIIEKYVCTSHPFYKASDSTHRQTDILDQWTSFLVDDSLIPEHQLSTDDFAGTLANQTNLAIKGTVGSYNQVSLALNLI